MLARCFVCMCAPRLAFHSFIQLKVLSHNFSLCWFFFRFLSSFFLWPVWNRPTRTTMSSTLRYFRVHTANTLYNIFVCSVVEFVFIPLIFITNIFMDCIWWTAVNPFGHWARESERWWHGIKIERLPFFKHLIRTPAHICWARTCTLCGVPFNFTHFLSGNRRHLWCLNFIAYYSVHSFCVMEFFAFPLLLDRNVGYSPIYYPIHPRFILLDF